MLVIRLTRVGKKNSPAYRVVVADKRRAVKRKFVEIVGHYNPIRTPKELAIDKERAIFWMERGAQPSDTVRNFMVDLGILGKDQKKQIVYGRPKSKKEIKNPTAEEQTTDDKEQGTEGQTTDDKEQKMEETVEEQTTDDKEQETEEQTTGEEETAPAEIVEKDQETDEQAETEEPKEESK